jgi:hypothetical protein
MTMPSVTDPTAPDRPRRRRPHRKQPLRNAALARVGVMIAARFGFDLSVDEVLTLLLALEALSGYWTWQRVTPHRRQG